MRHYNVSLLTCQNTSEAKYFALPISQDLINRTPLVAPKNYASINLKLKVPVEFPFTLPSPARKT
jgi:hypothetical protein